VGKSILVTGYSKAPGKTSVADVYTVVGVCMEVRVSDGIILGAECTLATELSKTFVSDLLIGEEIKNIARIEEKFKEQYQGSAKKALVTAMKICYDRYFKALENRKNLTESKK
jgi:hypothetical protein